MPRAETPAVQTGSLDVSQAWVTGLRTEAHQYDHNITVGCTVGSDVVGVGLEHGEVLVGVVVEHA